MLIERIRERPTLFPDNSHISPGEGFTKLPLPEGEGRHTGGPFLSPDGLAVWKPLDCQPFPDETQRMVIHEDLILEYMAGYPGFPKNWYTTEQQGRRWLVRKKVPVMPEDDLPTTDDVLYIEQSLRILNAKGLAVNDHIRIGRDLDSGEPFHLDLSSAAFFGGNSQPYIYQARDQQKFEDWAEEVGHSDIVLLRRKARHLTSSIQWSREHDPTFTYVYASPYSLDSQSYVAHTPAYIVPMTTEVTGMHTWFVFQDPPDEETRESYHLTWGWNPLIYEVE